MQTTDFKWWQSGIIYEVYVRSFQDSNDDGVGDIKGILQRLDYLQWLGVTAVWLTPVYPSPMKDFGYDISDYTNVHSLFGSMDDFDELITQVHRRGMKLIVDLVPNHTSNEHPWFIESASSKDNSKSDWYYWHDPLTDGSPPNNWLSVLGGPAWEWSEARKQFYYHAFLKEQPDLNLRNADVQAAIKELMKFWLDKGVDGFRVDVMWHLAKDEKLRHNPINPDFKPEMPDCDRLLQIYSCDQPEVHSIVQQFREVMNRYADKVMLGELYLPIHRIVPYYGVENNGAQLPGNFQLLFLEWKAEAIGIAIDQYEAALPDTAWPNWVIGNHDRSRLIDRIGDDQAKVAAVLLMTLRGTPIMYYGDEIGMHNVQIPKEEWQDPQGLLMPDKNLSRDPQRTPMQWSRDVNARFTNGRPWLRLSDDYQVKNVEAQKSDDDSLLCFYKKIIALRQRTPALLYGDYYPVPTDGNTLSYCRKWRDETAFLMVLNLTGEPQLFKPATKQGSGKVVFSTDDKRVGASFSAGDRLQANEAVIVELNA